MEAGVQLLEVKGVCLFNGNGILEGRPFPLQACTLHCNMQGNSGTHDMNETGWSCDTDGIG